MPKGDWRKREGLVQLEPETELQPNEWYRSPLWTKDHVMGLTPTHINDGVSWCGRALTVARDWEDEELGGLWYTNRKSASCPECKRRQTEWDGRKTRWGA